MVELVVLKKRLGPVLGRHPWVFSGALQKIPEGLQNGEPIRLVSENGRFLALGYFNSYSQMAVRLWGFEENEEVDQNFFTKRVKKAWAIREKYLDQKKNNAFRVINSENDFLPGLVADKYANYLSIQFHNPGIRRWQPEIIKALQETFQPKGILIREENKVSAIIGEIPEKVEISENGYKFLVNLKEGQKTGFFLDQRDKREAIKKYVFGKKVLNCFSYTGGFSVYALAAGASQVINVDSSKEAMALAEENIKINNLPLEKSEFICEDVKKYFSQDIKNKFDVIILDPPAFIKDRRKIREGIVGYKKINELAMAALPENGILITCSCSQHLPMRDFRFLLSEAAGKAGRNAQILESYTHGIDHPQITSFSEAEYLKCLIILIS
ncbi:MAG: class I SAM-dependent rRNA methyltransferase [Patescibacteria group bacterium]|jgi:23S rRNA (cytosine1962-C5)-methyltransferase